MAKKRTKVAFIGLGLMGEPMAWRLLKAGYPLAVWDRTSEKAAPLAAEGARKATTPETAAKGSDFIVLMLADDAAVDAVLFGDHGVARAMKRRSMLINCSTTSPGLSYRVATALRSMNVRYLEAPVMWSVSAAREGKLQVLVGGSRDDFARAKSILEVFGKDAHYVGEVGKAATLKIGCNLMLASMTQVFGELFVLARKAGIPFETMMEVLHAGPLESPVYGFTEQAVVNPGGRPNFYLKHMLKDMNLAADLARQLEVPIPVTAGVRQILTSAKNLGRSDEDFTSVLEVMAAWAGISVRG